MDQPVPIWMFGKTHCDDTDQTRAYLQAHSIPFQEVNIDHHPQAEQFVVFINAGNRSTPTLVFGSGPRKLILTEPEDAELDYYFSTGFDFLAPPE